MEDPKSLLKMLISLNNFQIVSKFWIRPNEADVLLVNRQSNAVQERGCNLEPLNL